MAEVVRKTIVVAEDDPMLREALVKKISTYGYQVLPAVDGVEALELIVQNKPDLVLLDIMMPKMTGPEVLKKLRALPWGASLPVIILSNVDPSAEVINDISPHAPAYYLIKAEVMIEDIIEKVTQLC